MGAGEVILPSVIKLWISQIRTGEKGNEELISGSGFLSLASCPKMKMMASD